MSITVERIQEVQLFSQEELLSSWRLISDPSLLKEAELAYGRRRNTSLWRSGLSNGWRIGDDFGFIPLADVLLSGPQLGELGHLVRETEGENEAMVALRITDCSIQPSEIIGNRNIRDQVTQRAAGLFLGDEGLAAQVFIDLKEQSGVSIDFDLYILFPDEESLEVLTPLRDMP